MDMTNLNTRDRCDNRGVGAMPAQRERDDFNRAMGQNPAVSTSVLRHLSHGTPRTGIGTGMAYPPAEDFGMVRYAPRAGRLVGLAGVLRQRLAITARRTILSRWSLASAHGTTSRCPWLKSPKRQGAWAMPVRARGKHQNAAV
jgi:hypothetical protein